MRTETWIKRHATDLSGKWVAVTGATGGIGEELCRYLATWDASLILLNRNAARSAELEERLKREFPDLQVKQITVDLADMASVRKAADRLETLLVDVLIHNAGAYAIPRYQTDTGYDSVFQINFLSPYYLTRRLLPRLRQRQGRVVVAGSIAHNYSKMDTADIDFVSRKGASKVYGNSKRWLMFALYELFQGDEQISLAVTHPGIAFTGITAHYPKWLFALIKYPMKVIFMKPRRAALSMIQGVRESTPYHTWIGPWLLDIWGLPKKKKLTTCTKQESEKIGVMAEALWQQLQKETKKPSHP